MFDPAVGAGAGVGAGVVVPVVPDPVFVPVVPVPVVPVFVPVPGVGIVPIPGVTVLVPPEVAPGATEPAGAGAAGSKISAVAMATPEASKPPATRTFPVGRSVAVWL